MSQGRHLGPVECRLELRWCPTNSLRRILEGLREGSSAQKRHHGYVLDVRGVACRKRFLKQLYRKQRERSPAGI